MQTIHPKRINAENYAAFGHVARVPSGEPLAADETFKYWSDSAHYRIEGETEIGYCTVYREDDEVVAWMEQHAQTPEILIPVDRPFILPVMSDDGRIEAFQAKPGEAVVIRPGVWHSACKPVDADEATYFVLFRRGTPHQDVSKKDIEPVRIAKE